MNAIGWLRTMAIAVRAAPAKVAGSCSAESLRSSAASRSMDSPATLRRRREKGALPARPALLFSERQAYSIPLWVRSGV